MRAAGLATAMLLAALTGAAQAQTPVKFSLDFKIDGTSAPFLLTLDKGYFQAEGLNVTIDPGAGSLETIGRVASGTYDLGFADINVLIKFRDANPDKPAVAVFMMYNKPPYAVIGRKSRGIRAPKDLEGKKLGAPAGDNSFAQWPIFVKANGIDAAKVTIENVSFPVREPMLAAGQVDAVTGRSFATFIDLKDKGVPVDDITVLLMADFGVELYGSAVIVNPKFAAAHPDAVKGFLRALLKGLKESVKQPSAAIESVMRRSDGTRKKDVEIERLKLAISQNIVTAEVKANGFGGIDSARFARGIEQLALTTKFKAKPKPNEIFDASYLPPAADRKAN
ncbi:MAG: ABC transporter substrate-binding protein [Pseudolabrys sp.]